MMRKLDEHDVSLAVCGAILALDFFFNDAKACNELLRDIVYTGFVALLLFILTSLYNAIKNRR